MVIKPNELEQKAFDERLATLEARIDKHLILHAENIAKGELVGYIAPYDADADASDLAEIFPINVVKKVIQIYRAAGWDIIESDYFDRFQLSFKPKQE